MRRSISVALACVLVLACALLLITRKPDFNFDGHWFGHADRKAAPGQNEAVVYTLGRIDLNIHDGSFDMSEGSLPVAGTVDFGGGNAYLTIKTRFERPLEPNDPQNGVRIELRPQKDGTIIFQDPKGFETGPIKLVRQPQPKP